MHVKYLDKCLAHGKNSMLPLTIAGAIITIPSFMELVI